MMNIEITHAENGYMVEYESSIRSDNGQIEKTFFVFEYADDAKLALTRLFEWMAERDGYGYDKFGTENLNITWDKKGHKVD